MHDDFYQMYLEEIKEMAPCTKAEQEELLRAAAAGNGEARERLIEGSLKEALACAREFDGRGVLLTDLVQESNVALILAVQEYIDRGEQGEFDVFVRERMKTALDLAVKEQLGAEQTKEELAARANVLQTVSQVLSKELEREATLAELAAKMKMTEYQVREIMKMALDAMNLNTEGLEAMAREEGVGIINASSSEEETGGETWEEAARGDR